MYCILTDGSEIFASIVVADNHELAILNKDAFKKTDGNFHWEPGVIENYTLPRASCYKHISGGLGGIYVG